MAALKALQELVHSAIAEAGERGDVPLHLSAIQSYALLAQEVAPDVAPAAWQEAYDRARLFGVTPEAHTILSLAAHAYAQGAIGEGRRLLAELPASFNASFGGVQDISRAVLGPERLAFDLELLADRILATDSPSFADIRLIAEMQRDALGRAVRPNADDGLAELFKDGLSDTIVAGIACRAGRVAVLEWIEGSEHMSVFVTVVAADRAVNTVWLPATELDLVDLAETMHSKLSGWTRKRIGRSLRSR